MNGRGFNIQDFANFHTAPMPIRPASTAAPAVVKADQRGYIDSDDPATVVTDTNLAYIQMNGNTGSERQALFRLKRPVRSIQGVVVAVQRARIQVMGGGASLPDIQANLDLIQTPNLDLSTINWNNRATLTYAGGFVFQYLELAGLGTPGVDTYAFYSNGGQQEVAVWSIAAGAGNITYATPVTGFRLRFITSPGTDIMQEIFGPSGGAVEKSLQVFESAP